jgi:hypothetical protein
MVEINYLPSTLLMGLFLIAILVSLVRIRSGGETSTASGERSMASDLPSTTASDVPARSQSSDTVSSETPTEWVLGFILLVLAAGGGAILFIGDYSLPSVGTQVAVILLVLVLGGLFCGYLFSGVYISLRSHGRKSAEATAVALWLLGLLGVGVIAAKLLFGQ